MTLTRADVAPGIGGEEGARLGEGHGEGTRRDPAAWGRVAPRGTGVPSGVVLGRGQALERGEGLRSPGRNVSPCVQ